MFAPALTILSFFSGVGFCKVYEDVADLPSLHYDFVIVGGMSMQLNIGSQNRTYFRGDGGQRRCKPFNGEPKRICAGA